MGWFWNDAADGSDANDPFRRLDPEVRAFLLRESPLKPTPTPTLPPTTTTTPPPPSSSEHPAAPTTPSKYGDRYADIWTQYRSPHSQKTARSAQEQLSDIVQAYKWRKGAIGRAALENCTDQQAALYQCYRTGSVRERLTACSALSHQLQDCYTAQAKLLGVLGYMSDFERAPDVDERIQMHADKMYRDGEEEAAAAAAGSAGGAPHDDVPRDDIL